MLPLYMFSLAFGGILLGASILLGGKDADGPDLDADGPELDADGVELDADGGLDKDVDPGLEAIGTGIGDFIAWSLRSVRFWTFFLAFFGLTGLALEGLELIGSSVVVAVIAVSMGALAGFSISAVVRALKEGEGELVADAGSYVGKSAKVLVAPGPNATGKVRVEVRGNTVDVLASTDETDIAVGDEVLVIEMQGTTARVSKVATS